MAVWRARQTVRVTSMGPDAAIEPDSLPANGCYVLSAVTLGHSFDVAFVGSSDAIEAGVSAPIGLFAQVGGGVGRTHDGVEFRSVSRGLSPRDPRSIFVDSAASFAQNYELAPTPEVIEYAFTRIPGRDCEPAAYDIFLTRVEYSRDVGWDDVFGGPEIRVQSFVSPIGATIQAAERTMSIEGARDTYELVRPMPQGVPAAHRFDPGRQMLTMRFFELDAMGDDLVTADVVNMSTMNLPTEPGVEVPMVFDVRRGETVTIRYVLTVRRATGAE